MGINDLNASMKNELTTKSNLVSVIITCYNQEQFISEAIESVIQQTYQNIECIIVDDGSTDYTSLICNEYLKNDARVKYVYQQNKGVSVARNIGFSMSKGDFIQFLDGDDFLSKDKLKRQFEFLFNNENFDLCYSNYSHYFQDKKQFQESKHRIVDINPIENFLFSWDRDVGTTIHSALFRRDIWLQNEMPFPVDYKSRYEDWVFWVLVALKNKKVGYNNFVGAFYRIHSSNLTGNHQTNTIYFFNAMFYIQNKIPEKYRQKFIEHNTGYLLEKYAKNKIYQEIYITWEWKLVKLTRLIFFPILNIFNLKSK
jgi:glycosyltransferase involved in cell wall biosynthesis